MLKKLSYLLIIAVAMCACHREGDWHTADGAVWGTTYHIVYQNDKNLDAEILAAMNKIDSELSVFNPESTVSRFNAEEIDTVSKEFYDVFTLSKEINEMSDGAFDPTVGPLIALWGFGEKGHDTPEPDSAAIAEALYNVGINKYDITKCGNAYAIMNPRMDRHPQFNFSAIAKGYGVDLVAKSLKDNGCENFMVEIGGEISVSGHNPQRRDWQVQIDAPVQGNGHNRLMVIPLKNEAIATSGNYRNNRVLADGTRVGHTISPVTGRPIITNILSATIIAPTCAEADALATACMAMPLADAHKMLALNMRLRMSGVRAYLVTADTVITVGVK